MWRFQVQIPHTQVQKKWGEAMLVDIGCLHVKCSNTRKLIHRFVTVLLFLRYRSVGQISFSLHGLKQPNKKLGPQQVLLIQPVSILISNNLVTCEYNASSAC